MPRAQESDPELHAYAVVIRLDARPAFAFAPNKKLEASPPPLNH